MRLGLWRDARLKLDVGCWEVGLGMIHCVCIMQSPNKTSHFTTYPSSNNQGSSKWVPVRKFCFIQKFRAIFHFHDYGRKGRYSTCVCPFHFSPWVLASSIVSGRVSATRNPPPGLCDPCPTHRGGGCGSIDACVRLQDSTWA